MLFVVVFFQAIKRQRFLSSASTQSQATQRTALSSETSLLEKARKSLPSHLPLSYNHMSLMNTPTSDPPTAKGSLAHIDEHCDETMTLIGSVSMLSDENQPVMFDVGSNKMTMYVGGDDSSGYEGTAPDVNMNISISKSNTMNSYKSLEVHAPLATLDTMNDLNTAAVNV